MRFSQFNRLFLLTTFTPLTIIGIVNFIIDPYGVYPVFKNININQNKPQKDNNDRLFKAIDVIRLQPKTVIIGSSRTKWGIDPRLPLLAAIPPTYNLAINGPNMYETRRYFDHALANQPDLRRVIIALDFFMFNQSLENQDTFSETRLGKTRLISQDAVTTLFSLDALFASLKTVETNYNHRDRSDQAMRDGQEYHIAGFLSHQSSQDGRAKNRFRKGIKQYLSFYSDYQLSQDFIAEFQAMIEQCRARNIELMVFISPAHATQWEVIRVSDRWDIFEEWKRQVVNILPIWDFSGYNSITNEPIAEVMTYFTDNSHYDPLVGEFIMDRMFARSNPAIPVDFGRLLTPETIEAELARIRRERETWAQQNSDDVQLVNQLQTQFLQQGHD